MVSLYDLENTWLNTRIVYEVMYVTDSFPFSLTVVMWGRALAERLAHVSSETGIVRIFDNVGH